MSTIALVRNYVLDCDKLTKDEDLMIYHKKKTCFIMYVTFFNLLAINMISKSL